MQQQESSLNEHQHSESEEEEEEEKEEPQHTDSQESDPQEQESSDHQASPPTSTPQKRVELPEECAICLYIYEEQERRPHALPCGHTFCSLCIPALMKEGHLTCPTCHTRHCVTRTNQFPVNYDLENMVRRFRTLQTEGAHQATAGRTEHNGPTGLGRKMKSMIKELKESMQSLGGTLQQELNQLEQYRERLSLSLAKHSHLLEEVDRVAQQHQKAMKLLMEEDLKVKAFMEEGEKNQKDIKVAQNQLVCITSAQEAYPTVDTADNSAVVVEEWLRHSKEEFPSGTVYSTSCRVLETTEVVLQVISEDEDTTESTLEDEDTTESFTTGHPNCTILEMLEKIHGKSAELVKQHVKDKFRKSLEDGTLSPVKNKENNCFSFSTVTSKRDKSSSPVAFTFKFSPGDSGAEFPSVNFGAPSTSSNPFHSARTRGLCMRARRNTKT